MSASSSYWRSTLLWSILAAAFIGPGTVTTAAKAGASQGLGLLWALLFSILATMVLQEMAARLTLASGKNLGQIIGSEKRQGVRLGYLLFGAITLGCAAYQAGNLLGAMAGLQLLFEAARFWVLLLGLIAAALLWSGDMKIITRLLAVVIAGMGLSFLWVAFYSPASPADWVQGLVPSVNDESALLIIGLIGTTIVPYNLFLAAGISKGQKLGDMRRGLLTSVAIGGLITLAIMLSGTQVQGEFSFAALADTLRLRLGAFGPYLLGIGLFAAGLSSAVTAPLAAAITGQSLFGDTAGGKWQNKGAYFRLTWIIVLVFGLGFALTDVKPIPAIIAAQAINGFILPLVAIFLLLRINDPNLLEPAYRNKAWLNIAGLAIVGLTVFLGLHNLWLALAKVFPALQGQFDLDTRLMFNVGFALMMVIGLGASLFAKRKEEG